MKIKSHCIDDLLRQLQIELRQESRGVRTLYILVRVIKRKEPSQVSAAKRLHLIFGRQPVVPHRGVAHARFECQTKLLRQCSQIIIWCSHSVFAPVKMEKARRAETIEAATLSLSHSCQFLGDSLKQNRGKVPFAGVRKNGDDGLAGKFRQLC